MLKHILAILLLFPAMAQAEEVVNRYVEDAQTVGSARLSYLFWDVYDATLYAPQGEWSADQPFALKLNYLLEIAGDDIAERSVEEMRKQGYADEVKLAAWYSQMKAIFPDVQHGTELVGIYQPGQPTPFYLGQNKLGIIQDVDFGRWFFSIWLSEATSEPALRRKLLRL